MCSIEGGDRLLSTTSEVTLSAAQSYDEDAPDEALLFAWSCREASSSASCGAGAWSDAESAIVRFTGSTLGEGQRFLDFCVLVRLGLECAVSKKRLRASNRGPNVRE